MDCNISSTQQKILRKVCFYSINTSDKFSDTALEGWHWSQMEKPRKYLYKKWK